MEAESKVSELEKRASVIEAKLKEHKREMNQYSDQVKTLEDTFEKENGVYQVCSIYSY